jgi:hypothetical protein
MVFRKLIKRHKKMDYTVKKVMFMVFMVLIGFGCKKKITINGRVYNPLTNEGFSHVKVFTTKDKFCLGYSGCGGKTLKETVTDEDGYYSITYRGQGKHLVFNCISNEGNYFCNYIGSQGASIELTGQTHYDLTVLNLGYLQKHYHNVNCYDSTDRLVITHRWHELSSVYDAYFPSGAYLEGCLDKYSSLSEVAMGWHYHEGYVERNGATIPFIDSVYVPIGDTVVWDIEY